MMRTPKARALGAALRDAREARKWTTRELADRISRNHGEISRWETGDRTPRPEYVAQVLTALGVTGDPYDEVMSLAYETNAPLWVATTLPAQRQQLAAFIELERTATMIVQASPLLVPGLLQTRDYAQAIMGVGNLSSDDAVTRVAIRMGRRDVVAGPNPVPLTAFIGDSVLTQIIGNRSVMFEQFKYLLEMAKRPNIAVRVMPSDNGWHPGFEGPFIFVLTEDKVPVVHLELRRTSTFLHEEDDVSAYKVAVNAIGRVSLSPEASVQLIADRMEKLS